MSFLFIFLSISIIILLFNLLIFFKFFLNYFHTYFDSYDRYIWSILIDSSRGIFLEMLSLVCFLVYLFRKNYMEEYRNKKFILHTTFFAFCILILSTRGRILNLMIGWDLLGISSLFLIMFYPNKVTMYNSYLTMLFNRLGDVLLILSLSFLFFSSPLPRINSASLFLSSFTLALCSFSKRAQFPLSRWLPAAISAPTPISALVHSSTLVTAGSFLVLKFFRTFEEADLQMIFFVRTLSFILGGLIACYEFDLKKIVAFSTISQISMVILFIRSGAFTLGLIHVLFHALFKRALFCVFGSLFLSIYRDQSRIFLKNTIYIGMYKRILIIIRFLMRGFFFSRSFFTKDLFLEITCSRIGLIIFFLCLLGSSFTIFYICKLSMVRSSIIKISTVKTFKLGIGVLILYSCFVSMFSGWIFKSFFYLDIFFFLNFADFFPLFCFIYFPLLFSLAKFVPGFFQRLSLDISYMKRVSFSLFSKLLRNEIKDIRFSEYFIFKPIIFTDTWFFVYFHMFNKNFLLLILMLIFFFWYPYSLFERSFEAAKDLGYIVLKF